MGLEKQLEDLQSELNEARRDRQRLLQLGRDDLARETEIRIQALLKEINRIAQLSNT